MFSLAAVQVTVVVNTLIASLLRSGTVSYLYYADRVMEFPLGVFGIALATAVLPSMSSQAARGEHAALRSTLGFALRLSAFIAVPAAVGLVALAEPIVRLLLERGAVRGDRDAVHRAGARGLCRRAFPHSPPRGSPRRRSMRWATPARPVLVGFVSVAANVVFALSLMRPLEHMGLALASSLSAYVNLLGLAWLLSRRLDGLGAAEIIRSLARTLAASAGLGIWCVWSVPMLGGGSGRNDCRARPRRGSVWRDRAGHPGARDCEICSGCCAAGSRTDLPLALGRLTLAREDLALARGAVLDSVMRLRFLAIAPGRASGSRRGRSRGVGISGPRPHRQ